MNSMWLIGMCSCSNASASFFRNKEVELKDVKKLAQKKKAKLIILLLKSSVKGEIGAAKLVKFSEFLSYMLEKNGFKVLDRIKDFRNLETLRLLLIYRVEKETIIRGPPLKLKEHAERFRSKYGKVFIKSGRLYFKLKLKQNIKDILNKVRKGHEIKDMDIASLSVINS